ncbi:hypothetical protein [Nocardia sp. NPDC019304]|uniref:hypothetical protein n=1 Tax=unclassified Nocardia TaxID=2637762 RepID=UPI0033D38129
MAHVERGWLASFGWSARRMSSGVGSDRSAGAAFHRVPSIRSVRSGTDGSLSRPRVSSPKTGSLRENALQWIADEIGSSIFGLRGDAPGGQITGVRRGDGSGSVNARHLQCLWRSAMWCTSAGST